MLTPHAFAQSSNESVVTQPPNAPSQEPAFENQTRAPQPDETVEVSTETVVEGLPQLWSMEFLPNGSMLVAAKQGAMHIITPEGEVGPEISGVPEVMSQGQGGLLDIALAPDFEESNQIFFSFAEPRGDGNGTSVASATLQRSEDGAASLEDVSVIFQQMPSYDGDMHFGSRLVFSPEGELYVTVGERSDTPIRDHAQDLTQGQGKIFRITPEGEPAEGNPYTDHAAIQGEIFTWGHRNLQSAALDGEGNLWTVEHGPRGGDELNQPQSGRNYGWPVITYGISYDGTPVGNGRTAQEGLEQPVYYWDPVIAPSGMAWYEGDEFPEWEDSFLIGGLVTQGIVVVEIEDGRVATESRVPLEARVRDVRVGPDGAVYAVTEDRDSGTSSILRLTNAS
nr:PQQ-dependent sugar dehydrogenase [Devosia pacifica]